MKQVPPTRALAEDLRAPTRWPALDGVRGLALLGVVGFHAFRMVVLGDSVPSQLDASPITWPVSVARFGLDAFFVLSGFLIVGSWTSLRRRHDRLAPALRQYAKKRAARILPAYWLSLIILVPLVAPHLLRSPGKLGLLATVQQYVMPSLPSEVNVVYWSLTTEVHFYLLAPLVALLLQRFGGWKLVVVSGAVAVLWRYQLPFGLAPSSTLGCLGQFVVGAAAAELVADHGNGQRSHLVAALNAPGVGAMLVAVLFGLGTFEGAVLDGVGHGLASKALHPVVGLVIAALFVRLLTSERMDGRASWLEHPSLRLAGLISYGVYLFHYPVLASGLRAAGIEAGGGAPVVRVVAVVAGLVVAAMLAGAISYLLIERRFLALAGRGEQPARPVIELRDQATAGRAVAASR